MDLTAEYRIRRSTQGLTGTHHGLLFFNEYKKPALVVHTSLLPKIRSFCDQCKCNSTLALETYISNEAMGSDLEGHYHIKPEEDIIKWMQMNVNSKLEPVKLSHGSHIELWFWNFCFFNSRIKRSNGFREWFKTQTHKEPERTYSAMFRCALEYSAYFKNYYDSYRNLISKRKYLYFE